MMKVKRCAVFPSPQCSMFDPHNTPFNEKSGESSS